MKFQEGFQSALLVTCFCLGVTAGCTTKANANRQAKLAYLAGQQQAQANMVNARRTSVRVLGNVRNPEIIWEDGLTLARVIADAEYQSSGIPREIVVTRQRERFVVDPNILLRGDDMPVEPGDTIEIHP